MFGDDDHRLSSAAVRLCVRPVDWVRLAEWSLRSRGLLPLCDVARDAFVAYRLAGRASQLVVDPFEAVTLFVDVYRALARDILVQDSAGALVLPSFRATGAAGGQLVFERTGRVVFLDVLLRAVHRHAHAAGMWELAVNSWRALGRCLRSRGPRHDLRGLLDRPVTPFRLFALHGAYYLCPKCGVRNFARPFRWPVAASLSHRDAYLRLLPERGVSVRCRMHEASRHEYAVPDLLATSPISGSARVRWTYWPRYNEVRDVFEELVTEENRCWPTFLDFSYMERRAMQCICVFCDVVQDPSRCCVTRRCLCALVCIDFGVQRFQKRVLSF